MSWSIKILSPVVNKKTNTTEGRVRNKGLTVKAGAGDKVETNQVEDPDHYRSLVTDCFFIQLVL